VARRGTTTTKENRPSFSLIFTILKSISSREKMYTRATNETFPSIKTYNLIRRKVIREGHNSRTDQSHTHTHNELILFLVIDQSISAPLSSIK
jgi:hypothetical protein